MLGAKIQRHTLRIFRNPGLPASQASRNDCPQLFRMPVGEAGIAEPSADRERRPMVDILHERRLAQALHHRVVMQNDAVSSPPIFGIALIRSGSARLKQLVSGCRANSAPRDRSNHPRSIMPGQPMPMNGASLTFSVAARSISRFSIPSEIVDGFLALDVALRRHAATTRYFHTQALERSVFLFRLRLTIPALIFGPPISTARIAPCALNIHARREMCGTEQSGFVRFIANWNEVDLYLVCFQDDGGAADRQFADAPGSKAAADHDAFCTNPSLQLQEAPYDQRQIPERSLRLHRE